MNILIVDDHEILKDGISLILKNEYLIDLMHFASNGMEAMEMTSNNRYDLILLDISMPGGLDGLTVLEKIRNKQPDAKIVMLTMFENIDLQKKAFNLGANGYLIKELNRKEMIHAIDSILANHLVFDKEIITKDKQAKKFHLPITQREKEVFILTVMGYSLKETAQKLNISVKTIENHRMNISRKLKIQKRQEWIEIAMKYNLIEL